MIGRSTYENTRTLEPRNHIPYTMADIMFYLGPNWPKPILGYLQKTVFGCLDRKIDAGTSCRPPILVLNHADHHLLVLDQTRTLRYSK